MRDECEVHDIGVDCFLRVRYGILNVQGRILAEATQGDGQARKVNILVPNCWIMAYRSKHVPQHLGKFLPLVYQRYYVACYINVLKVFLWFAFWFFPA